MGPSGDDWGGTPAEDDAATVATYDEEAWEPADDEARAAPQDPLLSEHVRLRRPLAND